MLRLVRAFGRLTLDLIVVVLRLLCWLIERLCVLLEAASLRLKPGAYGATLIAELDQPILTVSDVPVVEVVPELPVAVTAVKNVPVAPITKPRSIAPRPLEAEEETELDKLARQLWGPKGKPDHATYELATTILDRVSHVPA